VCNYLQVGALVQLDVLHLGPQPPCNLVLPARIGRGCAARKVTCVPTRTPLPLATARIAPIRLQASRTIAQPQQTQARREMSLGDVLGVLDAALRPPLHPSEGPQQRPGSRHRSDLYGLFLV
jgi:hypothetical protein